jgi:O-antigen/teichoic acid export membrane protein
VQYSDKLFLAHYTNTQELGYYSAANAIGGMIMLASVSIGNIFFPLFSSMLAKQDWDGLKKKVLQYQEFLAIFAFPFVCAVVIISSPLLTTVLGQEYKPSIEPFMIIAFATYVVVVGMPYGNIITGAGKFYLSVWINLIKLAGFGASITFFVSPKFLGFGATGLALNLLVVNLLTNFLYLQFAKGISGLSFFDFKNLMRYVLIFATAVAFFSHRQYFSQWIEIWWIVAPPVFITLVYGMLFLLGLINTAHFRQLADLLNVGKVFAYVRRELGGKAK